MDCLLKVTRGGLKSTFCAIDYATARGENSPIISPFLKKIKIK